MFIESARTVEMLFSNYSVLEVIRPNLTINIKL